MNIFFDLDGTLIDAKLRLYLLFQTLVPASGLTFQAYWDLKKSKVDHRSILKNYFAYSEEQFIQFEKIWLDKIEEPEWLALDKPFEGATEFLNTLKQNHLLYVITARQKSQAVILQLTYFGWENIFQDVLVSGPGSDKSQVISSTVKTTKNDWMVGDTGKDIETGKKLGIHTAAVLSGFLSREILISYRPDIVINSILDLKFLNNEIS